MSFMLHRFTESSRRYVLSGCLAVGMGLAGTDFATQRAIGQPQGPPHNQPGVEVLTRGPVHEAFAETVTFDPEPGIVVTKTPRDIIEELPPDQRPEGDNVTWVPGYWAWDDERNDYLWVSGIWRDLPPGRQWVPGYWGQAGQGHQWSAGYWADADASEVEYLPEPPQSVEAGPNIVAPATNLGWVPGCWIWQSARYVWRPGYWAAGRPDWVWVPAQYHWSPRGYVFSDGYWDHSVARRGVLFAPVYFEQNVYARPDFHYSPSIVINLAVFADQLFVRPHYQHYYFGDYYDNHYRENGYFASNSYQSSHRGYDPIYAHRRWENRNDRDWERRDRDSFNHRRDAVDARPARTWQAQRDRDNRASKPGENRTPFAAALDQLSGRHDGPTRFRKVEKKEREQLAQRGRAIQNTRRERQKLEAMTPGAPHERSARASEPSRVKLPKPLIVAKPIQHAGKDQAPPRRQITPRPDPKVEAKMRSRDKTKVAKATKGDPKGKAQK